MDGHEEDPAQGRSRARLTACGLVVLGSIAQWPLFDRGLVPMDEGHLAAAADWMLDGQRLYADVHTGIFPGIYLVTSGLFALFGRDLLVARAAGAAVNVVTMLALWSVARRVVSPGIALLPPLLHLALVAFAFPVLSMFNYSTLALALGLLGLSCLLRYLEAGRARDGALLGLCVAAAALTKQNFGALIFVALWASLAWSQRDSVLAGRGHPAALWPIGIAGAALTAAVATFFVVQGTLGDLVDSTVLSLVGSQIRDFDNPMPPILGSHPKDVRFVFLYSPPAVFDALVHGAPLAGVPITPTLRSAVIRLSYGVPIALLVAAAVLLWRTRSEAAGPRRNATRAAIAFAGIFSLGIFPSAIWSHLAFVTPPLFLIAALLADRIEGRLAAARPHRRPLHLAIRLTGAVTGVAIAIVAIDAARHAVRWNPHPLDLPRAHVRVSARDLELYRGAVAFVDACAAPGEPIVALPDIPIVWFLTDRPNPSPYDLAIPGNVDGGLIARRMRDAGVRCVVMNLRMYPEFPPFKQLFPGLARTLEQEFRGERVIAENGAMWVGLVRRTDVRSTSPR